MIHYWETDEQPKSTGKILKTLFNPLMFFLFFFFTNTLPQEETSIRKPDKSPHDIKRPQNTKTSNENEPNKTDDFRGFRGSASYFSRRFRVRLGSPGAGAIGVALTSEHPKGPKGIEEQKTGKGTAYGWCYVFQASHAYLSNCWSLGFTKTFVSVFHYRPFRKRLVNSGSKQESWCFHCVEAMGNKVFLFQVSCLRCISVFCPQWHWPLS